MSLPLAGNPIEGILLVQLNVPEANLLELPNKSIAGIISLLQAAWSFN